MKQLKRFISESINGKDTKIQNIDTLFDVKYSNVNKLNIFDAVKSFEISKTKFSKVSKLMKSYGLRDDIDYVAINLSDNGLDGPDTSFINAIFKENDYPEAHEIVKELQSNLELVNEEEVYINRWFSFLISLYKKGNDKYVFIGYLTDEYSSEENETWDEYYIVKL